MIRTSLLVSMLLSAGAAAAAPQAPAPAAPPPAAAERILGDVQKVYEQSMTTAEELDGTRVRVDRLREALAQSVETMEGLPELPAPARPVRDLLRERAKAEEKIERQEANLRRAQA